MDNKKFLITNYLKGKEAFGAIAAVKVEAIAKALEMSEDEVREKVKQERIDGMIICCGGKYVGDYGRPFWTDFEGYEYFLPISYDEFSSEKHTLETILLEECKDDLWPCESTLEELRTFWDADSYAEIGSFRLHNIDYDMIDKVYTYIHQDEDFHAGEA